MTIVAAAVVPHPPALLPSVTGRPLAEIEALRVVAVDAVRWVLAAGIDELVLVGAGPRTTVVPTAPSASVRVGARYRGELAANPPLPLALDVASSLLPAEPGVPVTLQAVAAGASAADVRELGASLADRPRRAGVIVCGDGSARRGPKAPGYEDPRAHPFDEVVERGLREGDTRILAGLDPAPADALLVAGRAAWQVLAAAVGERPVTARLDYADDPFGVQYFIARWQVG